VRFFAANKPEKSRKPSAPAPQCERQIRVHAYRCVHVTRSFNRSRGCPVTALGALAVQLRTPIPSSAKAGFSARDAFHRELDLGFKCPRRVGDDRPGTANPLRVGLIASEPNRFVLSSKLSDFSDAAKASFLQRNSPDHSAEKKLQKGRPQLEGDSTV
jgi:hypothetical protein